MNKFKILNFKYFPKIIDDSIYINKNIIFYKSYSSIYNYNKLSNKPSYFGELNNIINNLTFGKKIGCFSTKKKIKLIDIRYVSNIIKKIVLSKNNINYQNITEGINILGLSYGLIPLSEQIEYYKKKYYEDFYNKSIYQKILDYQIYNKENNGIRIGIIKNDVDSTFILKEIFEKYYDGIIFPLTYSPYFNNKFIHNELLLFNPSNCIFELEYNPNNTKNININEILFKNNINFFDDIIDNNLKNNIDYVFKKNYLIDEYYKNSINIDNLYKIGYEYKKIYF